MHYARKMLDVSKIEKRPKNPNYSIEASRRRRLCVRCEGRGAYVTTGSSNTGDHRYPTSYALKRVVKDFKTRMSEYVCIKWSENHTSWGVRVPLFIGEQNIRLKFRYLFVRPSSFAVTYASAMLTCIGSITNIRSVLTQSALNFFCKTFHIPDEVHPQLPNLNQTNHEMLAGKIGVYTRFFEYANFRLPLSTFLVNVLKHYRIHISQLSVIGAAKVSHFEILCRVHGFEPTVGLFRCFYVNSKNKGWIKSVSRDVIPKSFEFSTEHYATLENTYPQFLRNDDEEINLLFFICTADPTKVRIGERQRDEDEPKLLETTVGRVVPLLPVAPDRSSGKLEASVEMLFGEGGSGEQAEHGDSSSGGHGVGINVVADTSVEDVAPAQLKRQKKQKTKVADVGDPSHPAKKLRDDYRALGVNIAEAKVDSVVRTSMPIITIATTTTPTVDPAAIAKEKLVGSFVFGVDPPFAGESHPIPGGFSDCSGSDFLIGGIQTVIDHDSNLQEVYVPQWNVTNGFCLDDSAFTEFNIGAARQISLSAEVRMRAEYNIKERRRFNSVVEDKDSLLRSRCEEIESHKAQLLVKETEAAKAVHLRAEASKFKIVEKSLSDETQVLKERNATLEKEKSELEIKVTDVAASVKVREQKVADLDTVVISVKLQNDSLADQVHQLKASSDGFQEKVTWLLTHDMELAIAKCLNSTKYLCALGPAIGKAIEKGMQEGLFAGITHGAEGRKLTDVDAYNPSAKADYLSALQRLQSVNFSLIAELKANKDASVETIMNLLRLEDPLAEKLGLVESQPHVDQLMVPIHHSPNQRVIGASALSLSLDVSSTEGTYGVAPDTTTALSVTFVSASTIPPISTDDYEVVHMDGQEGTGAGGETVADESVVPFPNVATRNWTFWNDSFIYIAVVCDLVL
nr:transposase (putative), gypsy type [Tanacetum cinerariifolium]